MAALGQSIGGMFPSDEIVKGLDQRVRFRAV